MISGKSLRQPYPDPNKFLLLFFLFCFAISPVMAQKTWTGEAGDGLWANPNNWNDHVLPSGTDDVLIDGSAVPVNFTVTLPNTTVTVKTLRISPRQGQSIQVNLPATNAMEPGLITMGPGYGLWMDEGSVFQNASGLTSGESLVISDSIRIANGGKYIHHTRASHANNIVRLLSHGPGTESGIFEFDVPRASYTVSASNRIYGTLSLSSAAAGGTVNYTCNGSNPLTVNGNLRIGDGVSFNVDLGGAGGNILIKGDYIQNGGVFNIASGAGNSTVVTVNGNLIQSPAGVITETNTGLPAVELKGSSLQVVSLAGSFQNSVGFRMNNPEGAVLLVPLSLPYKLELIRGKISTSSASLLTLEPGCSVLADSTAANTSYIDGPLRKNGLANEPYFLFPVGKAPRMRWLELKNASGSFTVEYIRENPRLLSTEYGPGIDHISALEYWTVQSDNPLPAANLELSFQDPESGGVTDLSTLRVAELSNNEWLDAGAVSTSGSFGYAGSVVSNFVSPMQPGAVFTLAGSVNMENPLPVKLMDFRIARRDDSARVDWKIDIPEEVDHFELLRASRNMLFEPVGELPAAKHVTAYGLTTSLPVSGPYYFKLHVFERNGNAFFSKTLLVHREEEFAAQVKVFPTIVESGVKIAIESQASGPFHFILRDMSGRIAGRSDVVVLPGKNEFSFDMGSLSGGTYLLLVYDPEKEIFRSRLIKQ